MTQAPSPASVEFRRVAQQLRDDVHGGTYQPGERLPSAAELANQMGSNRSAVERAIRLVASEGLVTTRKGSGAFVSRILKRVTRHTTGLLRKRSSPEADANREALEAQLQGMGLVPRYFLNVRKEQAPEVVTELLGLKRSGENVLVREERVYAAAADASPTDPGTPVQLTTTYLPLDIAGGTALEHQDPGPLGVHGRLAELGHRPSEFTETIEVRPPRDDEAEFLEIDADNRVVQLTQTSAAAGRIVEIALCVLPAHLWSFSYQWTTDA